MTMERKIGEIFEHNGEWYQCVKDNNDGCECCDFTEYCESYSGNCDSTSRKDGKGICFKKLEKVGEPVLYGLRMSQRYKVSIPIKLSKDPSAPWMSYNLVDNLLYIEVKQQNKNTEDMKENKLNLKPFDLEAARSGKPVCTRDGHKVRIICFDAKGMNYPILALIEECEKESMYCYDMRGKSTVHTDMDLMMLSEKHEGWVNVYRDFNVVHAKNVFETREEALKNIGGGDNCVATVKIEWNE